MTDHHGHGPDILQRRSPDHRLAPSSPNRDTARPDTEPAGDHSDARDHHVSQSAGRPPTDPPQAKCRWLVLVFDHGHRGGSRRDPHGLTRCCTRGSDTDAGGGVRAAFDGSGCGCRAQVPEVCAPLDQAGAEAVLAVTQRAKAATRTSPSLGVRCGARPLRARRRLVRRHRAPAELGQDRRPAWRPAATDSAGGGVPRWPMPCVSSMSCPGLAP